MIVRSQRENSLRIKRSNVWCADRTLPRTLRRILDWLDTAMGSIPQRGDAQNDYNEQHRMITTSSTAATKTEPPRQGATLRPGARTGGMHRLRGGIDVGHYLPVQIIGVCAALVVLTAVQGCATLSETDCLTTDWAVLGEVDGQRGRPLSELNRYRRQCAVYGVIPDTQVYIEARERGLAHYCTLENGYREGRSGVPDKLVCPLALAPDFQRGHRLGRAILTSFGQLSNSGSAIRAARSDIEDLRAGIEDREASLRSDDLTDEEKKKNRNEIDSMDRRIDQSTMTSSF